MSPDITPAMFQRQFCTSCRHRSAQDLYYSPLTRSFFALCQVCQADLGIVQENRGRVVEEYEEAWS